MTGTQRKGHTRKLSPLWSFSPQASGNSGQQPSVATVSHAKLLRLRFLEWLRFTASANEGYVEVFVVVDESEGENRGMEKGEGKDLLGMRERLNVNT